MGDSGGASEGGIKGLTGNEGLDQFAKNPVVERLNGGKLLDRDKVWDNPLQGQSWGSPALHSDPGSSQSQAAPCGLQPTGPAEVLPEAQGGSGQLCSPSLSLAPVLPLIPSHFGFTD